MVYTEFNLRIPCPIIFQIFPILKFFLSGLLVKVALNSLNFLKLILRNILDQELFKAALLWNLWEVVYGLSLIVHLFLDQNSLLQCSLLIEPLLYIIDLSLKHGFNIIILVFFLMFGRRTWLINRRHHCRTILAQIWKFNLRNALRLRHLYRSVFVGRRR
mgnify:CR=1 FL=1